MFVGVVVVRFLVWFMVYGACIACVKVARELLSSSKSFQVAVHGSLYML